VIRFESVSFKYPSSEKYALQNVSTVFEPCKATVLVGPNGAGKSTFVRLMNGLLRPTQGKVWVLSKDTAELSVAQIAKHVGVVFQNPNHQIFSSTVMEEVSFALKNFGYTPAETADRARKALAKMNLLEYSNVSPFMLSSGEKKRLTIASVLAYEPDVLVFDEPTVGQDLGNKLVIGKIIREYILSQKCVVAVTHELDFATSFFDRMLILNNGSIVADSPPRKALLDPFLIRDNGLEITERGRLEFLCGKLGFSGVYDSDRLAQFLAERFCG
jgi:energy-coupling factor transport system ATP-binding protein